MRRIKRPYLYIAIIIIALLESTVLDLVSIANIRPNLMILVVIFVGLHSDWLESLEAGIVGGVLRGIMTSGSVGINLILLSLCGLFATYCKNKIYKDNFLTQIILTLFITLAASILNLFTRIVVKNTEVVNINLWYTFGFTIVLVSLYTSIFAPLCFFCLKKLLRVKELEF